MGVSLGGKPEHPLFVLAQFSERLLPDQVVGGDVEHDGINRAEVDFAVDPNSQTLARLRIQP